VYILNRSPTKSVKNKVPQEACVAYAHVLEESMRKLNNISEKCIFTGHSEQSKAYKLYNPFTKKFIINKDVEFKETKAWDGHIDKMMTVGVAIPSL